jgi:hypothetical protein
MHVKIITNKSIIGIFACLISILMYGNSFAQIQKETVVKQTIQVTGTVTDLNGPLPGVTILVQVRI